MALPISHLSMLLGVLNTRELHFGEFSARLFVINRNFLKFLSVTDGEQLFGFQISLSVFTMISHRH